MFVDTEEPQRKGKIASSSTNLVTVGPVIERPRRDGMGKERRLRQKARRRARKK